LAALCSVPNTAGWPMTRA